MSMKLKLVLMMIAAAAGVGGVLYILTEDIRLSLAISGVLLLTDLHFVPKMLPHIFERDEDKDT